MRHEEKDMIIAVPKEILPEEKRVAVMPELVCKYIDLGFKVHVEPAAGQGIGRESADYEKPGQHHPGSTDALCPSGYRPESQAAHFQ